MDICIVHFIKLDEDLGLGIILPSTVSYLFLILFFNINLFILIGVSYLFIARTPESDWNLARANNLGFSFPFAIGSVSN